MAQYTAQLPTVRELRDQATERIEAEDRLAHDIITRLDTPTIPEGHSDPRCPYPIADGEGGAYCLWCPYTWSAG